MDIIQAGSIRYLHIYIYILIDLLMQELGQDCNHGPGIHNIVHGQ